MSYRIVLTRVCVALLSVVGTTLLVATGEKAATASASPPPRFDSHWEWCNGAVLHQTPPVLWKRIRSATRQHRDIPRSFWTDRWYRYDIARIACFESTFNYHAENFGHAGWFQMTFGLIPSEGVSLGDYWSGSRAERAGWYQCTAGERYIRHRYGTPAAAWRHEEEYGWY